MYISDILVISYNNYFSRYLCTLKIVRIIFIFITNLFKIILKIIHSVNDIDEDDNGFKS